MHLQLTYFFRLGFWGSPGNTSGLVRPSFLPSMHPDGVGFFLPGSSLPSASTQKSPARPSHLSAPHVLCLFGVSIITQHFIPCVSLLKGKFPKGGSFLVPLTCYRLCQEACLAEVKLSKILLGERDVKLGQTSIGNGLGAGTLLGLGYAYLPLLMMQLASQLVICIRCAHLPLDIMTPPAMDGIGFFSPNNNPT